MTSLENDCPPVLTKSRQAFLELRSRILDGRLKPGTRLTLRPTARQLGVGMNAVGEALRALEHEGLVELEPKVGARVRARDLVDVRSVFILRLALESEAARQVAARAEPGALQALAALAEKADALAEQSKDLDETRQADTRFHLAVARFSGSPALERQLARLAPQLVILDPGRTHREETPLATHVPLVVAMRQGEQAAVEAMRAHILDAMDWAIGTNVPHYS